MELLNNPHIDWKLLIMVTTILLGAVILSRISRWLINKTFETTDKLKVDPTRYKFFKNAVSIIIWLFAFATIILLIPRLRALAITLFAGAGILVAIIGLAAQQAFANVISGIFIIVSKPFRVGDLIKVGNLDYGTVEDITLRHTIINSFQNKRIVIPNAVINSETIVNDNIEDVRVCRWIDIGISYDSDVELASRILQEESMKHPLCIDVRTKKEKEENIPQVNVRLVSFGDFSVNLRAFVWTNDAFTAAEMHSDINKAIKKRFEAEGIEIPFPYRTVVFKNDLPPNTK